MTMPCETPPNFLHGLADGWQRVKRRFSVWVGVALTAGLWRVGPGDSNAKIAAITILVLGAMLILLWGKWLGIDKQDQE